jgi:hypothetical protein
MVFDTNESRNYSELFSNFFTAAIVGVIRTPDILRRLAATRNLTLRNHNESLSLY